MLPVRTRQLLRAQILRALGEQCIQTGPRALSELFPPKSEEVDLLEQCSWDCPVHSCLETRATSWGVTSPRTLVPAHLLFGCKAESFRACGAETVGSISMTFHMPGYGGAGAVRARVHRNSLGLSRLVGSGHVSAARAGVEAMQEGEGLGGHSRKGKCT